MDKKDWNLGDAATEILMDEVGVPVVDPLLILGGVKPLPWVAGMGEQAGVENPAGANKCCLALDKAEG